MKQLANILSLMTMLLLLGVSSTTYAQTIRLGGQIFGGGEGELNADGSVKSSADVDGNTNVIIKAGKFVIEQVSDGIEAGKLVKDHNVFGGGNLACKVTGNTNVTMNASLLPVNFFAVDNTNPENPTSMYRRWGEYVGRMEGMAAAGLDVEKAVQGSVFGAGYGVHTSVLGTTNVNIAMGSEELINSTDDILTRYGFAKRGGDSSGETLASKFVITAFGGGYDGTANNTNVQISGSPYLQNVFGGGLGSKAGADANGGYASTVGTVTGSANVAINGATIYGNVYGGGAGIFGEQSVTIDGRGTAKMPYYKAAMVMKDAEVEIGGGTLVFGNVYGGGDIANTGWFEKGYRPRDDHQNYENESKAHLDLTTHLQMKGGNVMGNVFAGGNGRKMTELEKANFIGAVIGNTSVVLGKQNGSTWDAGTRVWGSVYGGGQNGSVYSCAAMAANNGGTARTLVAGLLDGCTNVEFKHSDIGQDIFGGGLGAIDMVDTDSDDVPDTEVITSANISGGTFVFFNRGNLITGTYWDPVTSTFKEQNCGGEFRDTQSDIAHNLYGGGNVACTIGTKDRSGNLVAKTGNTTIYMIGAPVVDADFMGSPYYHDALAIYGKPHFSAFGAGYGKNAVVLGNSYSDIALTSAGFHSVVGGGMNGPVEGECITHIACDVDKTLIHNVYGGGYYAPVGGTHLYITEGHILENVFGGGVMGNIAPSNADMTKSVASTIIGLKSDSEDPLSKYIVHGTDGSSTVREYTYANQQNKIIIDGNVYGGNDVSGTVNGIADLAIYGGEMKHDVYGAGNGDHDGYYEPGLADYDRGDWGTDNYYYVDHSEDVSTDDSSVNGPKGNTYVGRPQTVGGVKLTLAGNSTSDRVKVLGQVFGGGNSCTIGKWDEELLTGDKYSGNPHLVRDDPDYFLGGGKLSVTLGSHIRIGRTHGELDEASAQDKADYLQNVFVNGKNTPENVSGLYMGCSGRHLATQTTDVDDHNYHHYYDKTTARYWPGFAVYADNGTDLLTRAEGLASFRAYLNNILIKTDDVSLNIADDAEDIWLANFVGGGFRGSMKAGSEKGQFHYKLKRGVTVGHDVIGGAYNTDVVYHIFKTTDGHIYPVVDGHYQYLTDATGLTEGTDYHHIEYADGSATPTGIIRFYYNGGMLSELAYETDPATNDRINRIFKKYKTAGGSDSNKDFAGADQTTNIAFNKYRTDALVYLELENKLETEYVDGHVHGGNVFGGCFSSGRVEGDIWTDYRCYQEGQQAQSEDFNLSDTNFNKAKNFNDNFAMMLFGAGYGANTTIQGSAYVRVLHQEENPNSPISGMAYGYPRLYNVFGGSYEGKVEGNTNVYFNPGKYGYVAGAIYGGGCNGYVGGKTYVELAGGYVDECYGGARNANIGGGASVWAYDGTSRPWGEAVSSTPEKAPLFIGKIYGGTDISGKICYSEDGNTYTKENGYQPYFTASEWPKDLYVNGVDNSEGMIYLDTYLQVGGVDQSNRGFPIIGEIFAAGNGEKTKEFFDAKYAASKNDADQYEYNKLPHQNTAFVEVTDGNIVYAFGGGNRATVTEQNYIHVRSFLDGTHTISGLGGRMYDVLKKRVLNVAVDCYDEIGGNLSLKNASIQRLFGGNNIATMDIQPKWMLKSGRINNVYSGGNMGDMTYYNPAGVAARTNKDGNWTSGIETNTDGTNANYNPKGLSITIDQPQIHIVSLFGGCRMSDVRPDDEDYDDEHKWPTGAEGEDCYGATVNIKDGYIENVYGGNDVSGTVFHGTNVNISGAVSGNVYGSGNGFYLYKYDENETQVTEHISDEYGIYYTVPNRGDATSTGDTHKILTINAVRPSVEKAFLNIAGISPKDAIEKKVAYVKGNVYCGGNASTITGSGDNSFTKFKIGSYVTLNGVFMGSDGLAFTQNDHIAQFAKLNGITDMGATTSFNSGYELDAKHNPILLNAYMMAVDMKSQPKDFNLNLPLVEAHIGTYCGGGNRGSMLVDKTVTLPFHHDIVIYDKIVGACLDATVSYNQNGQIIKSYGGYTRALDIDNNGTNGNTKMNLTIASQFAPMIMDVPADKLPTTVNSHGETFAQAEAHDFLYPRMNANTYTASDAYITGCNIYGGCYQSGEVEGDIILNVHTNMLRYVNDAKLKQAIANNQACFNVYGAGYGQDSHVWGNVKINVERNLDTSIMGTIGGSTLSDALGTLLGGESAWNIQNSTSAANTMLEVTTANQYPSFNNIFGGGRSGQLIGNSEIQLKNGLVFSDVAGGCYASDMYGSSQIVVGYPEYYQCNTSGVYTLTRGDKWNIETKAPQYQDRDGNHVIKTSVNYLIGDLVPANVWAQMSSSDQCKFAKINTTPPHWDDVRIKVGGGIYGGGYSLANSTSGSAGTITTHKLSSTTINNRELNFNGRNGYDSFDTKEYGGNASIMVGDNIGQISSASSDHIRISSPVATVSGAQSYEGGIYGDGHLTFCEGFRAADVTGYGYAEGSAKNPILMNTFQRLDLLSVNDCCLLLQGAQDFATDAVDATIYSMTRVNELRLNSSLSKDATLGQLSKPTELADNESSEGVNFNQVRQRNYLAFMNNIHYLGSIISNDDFDTDIFHDGTGTKGSQSYKAEKQSYITAYTNATDKDNSDVNLAFKQRNVGTARNAVGINNGYALRIQNQYYDGDKKSQLYYGPVVGVVEVKLLSLQQGEGGGYVYADNVHADENNFLNTSGNFVFPGVVNTNTSIGNQYIVDDCFLTHFGSAEDITGKVNGAADEAHYWYVEGNHYYYNTTLTGYTFNAPLVFNLVENDPNILLSGLRKNSPLKVLSVDWDESNHSSGYGCVLHNTTVDKKDDYQFDLMVDGEATWSESMSRYTYEYPDPNPEKKIADKDNFNPQFNIRLQDKLDNSGDENYYGHLDEPEFVTIKLMGMNGGTEYYYDIRLKIVYLEGPTYTGGVNILNCALPGERIGFSSDGITIKTHETMPVTAYSWELLPLVSKTDGNYIWDSDHGIKLTSDQYEIKPDGTVEGSVPAYLRQNEYNIAYIFTVADHNFPVLPNQNITENPKQENRMIVVHNYHRMKDVEPQKLAPPVGSRIYIEDENDLRAFVTYLNKATVDNTAGIPEGLAGIDIILQKDITLTQALPSISQPFAGTFHGDGYHIDLSTYGSSLFGDNLAYETDAEGVTVKSGKVYNLGLLGGTITSATGNTADEHGVIATGNNVFNSYEYKVDAYFEYGTNAYDLSHHFVPTADGYVENYYANGDYQYAAVGKTTALSFDGTYLRTGAPNYGSTDTHHLMTHNHDVKRWYETDKVNIPLYSTTQNTTYNGANDAYEDDYLFFGQHLDKTNADTYPVHISSVAKGDAVDVLGVSANGGNRVYKAVGYYGDPTEDNFLYNKDAWALNHLLTDIDFTHMAAEPDGANPLPAKFSVDSNMDYDEDGYPIATGSYTNAAMRHVTQNLLVYNAGEAVFDKKDVANIAEKDVVYHNIVKNGETYATDYLHLVDKQEFWAPIAFNVGTRAWYERKPQTYRNVTTVGYGAGSAWEGIVLPFTAQKVTANVNGEISHFYGDDQLNHEYWLRGLTGVTTSDNTVATFARPVLESNQTAGFMNANQSGFEYTYQNRYFANLIDYDRTEDFGKHYADAAGAGVTFSDYIPLTAGVPYIVAFPGNDFYEFSMEGDGAYSTSTHSKSGNGQFATFETGSTLIPVTYAMESIAGSYRHVGTFLHESNVKATNAEGTAFETGNAVPFRTYLAATGASSAPTRGIIAIGQALGEEDDPFESAPDGLEIRVQDHKVIVTSTYDQTIDLAVYNAVGQLMLIHEASKGTTSFELEQPGAYIIAGTKVFIR